MNCPWCGKTLVTFPEVTTEKVDCPDCGKDWGNSYCGRCGGRGWIFNSITIKKSTCPSCSVTGPEKWWAARQTEVRRV